MSGAIPRKASLPEGRELTAYEIFRFGHIARAIRAALDAKGWSVPDLSQAIGRDRTYAPPYRWLKGQGAPGAQFRKDVAKALGIRPETLRPRGAHNEPPATEGWGKLVTEAAMGAIPAATAPANGNGALVPFKPPAPAPRAAPGEVVIFSGTHDGRGRVRLDITAPVGDAVSLFQILINLPTVREAMAKAGE